jgi:hypothetical protein
MVSILFNWFRRDFSWDHQRISMANYHPESKVSGSEIFIKSGTLKLGKSSLSVGGFQHTIFKV